MQQLRLQICSCCSILLQEQKHRPRLAMVVVEVAAEEDPRTLIVAHHQLLLTPVVTIAHLHRPLLLPADHRQILMLEVIMA